MKRNCAVCGGAGKKNIYRQTFVLPSANYFHAGYDVVVCTRCGFAYADNVPEQVLLDEYYRQMTKKTALLKRRMPEEYIEPDYVGRQHLHSLNDILPHLSAGDRILDIGCYTGNLLYLLKLRGWQNVLGLDPSGFAAHIAKDKYSIEVIVGSLFDDLDIGTFDCVILTHVLEHIADLRTLLFRITCLLNDHGKVYIEVPDSHNFFLTSEPHVQTEHTEPFFQFSVEHINYFTSVSLANLMRQMGFSQVFLENQVSTISILSSVWKLADLVFDGRIESCLNKYIADSKAMYGEVLAVADAVVKSGQEIFVWGAGLHTQKLLASSSLMSANIRAFVDSDSGYYGGTLMGKPIISPDELRKGPVLPILISSKLYQNEIEQQIRDDLKLRNKIIKLYDDQV